MIKYLYKKLETKILKNYLINKRLEEDDFNKKYSSIVSSNYINEVASEDIIVRGCDGKFSTKVKLDYFLKSLEFNFFNNKSKMESLKCSFCGLDFLKNYKEKIDIKFFKLSSVGVDNFKFKYELNDNFYLKFKRCYRDTLFKIESYLDNSGKREFYLSDTQNKFEKNFSLDLKFENISIDNLNFYIKDIPSDYDYYGSVYFVEEKDNILFKRKENNGTVCCCESNSCRGQYFLSKLHEK